jgi:hypothetical protein
MSEAPLPRWNEPPKAMKWQVKGYDIWCAAEGVYMVSRVGEVLRSFSTLLEASAWADMNEALS